MIKNTARQILSPILYKAFKNIWNFYLQKHDRLFSGDDRIFKALLSDAKIYAEYGCGASTIWVNKHTNCQIYSIDSSKVWINFVQKKCFASNKLNLSYCDVGPIGDWGVPVSYDKAENFDAYTDWVWQQGINPDIVLIDGIFRICCFLTSLLHAKKGTFLIFDDYKNNQYYHCVEQFLKPQQYCGKQAIFVVPEKNKVNISLLKSAINKFRYVI